MGWDVVAALGSVASAFILLIGAVAALVQIKHLRLANQLESYLQLMKELNSRDLVEARRYIEATDFSDPENLRAATEPDLDDRVRRIAVHYQAVARLLNLGVLDERVFVGHIASASQVWKALRPVVRVLRKRTGTPLFADIEYLVYRTAREGTLANLGRSFPKDFAERSGVGALLASTQKATEEADAQE